jgi:hypothetical protein
MLLHIDLFVPLLVVPSLQARTDWRELFVKKLQPVVNNISLVPPDSNTSAVVTLVSCLLLYFVNPTTTTPYSSFLVRLILRCVS